MGIRAHMEFNSVSAAEPVMRTKQVCCSNFILNLTTGVNALYSVILDSNFFFKCEELF